MLVVVHATARKIIDGRRVGIEPGSRTGDSSRGTVLGDSVKGPGSEVGEFGQRETLVKSTFAACAAGAGDAEQTLHQSHEGQVSRAARVPTVIDAIPTTMCEQCLDLTQHRDLETVCEAA